MMLIKDKETNEVRNIYSGDEIMIAFGMKFQTLCDEVKSRDTSDHYDIFNTKDNSSFTNVPIFASEEEFKRFLAAGVEQMRTAKALNNMKLVDPETNKTIEIHNYNDLKKLNRKRNRGTNWFIGSLLLLEFGFSIFLLIKLLGGIL